MSWQKIFFISALMACFLTASNARAFILDLNMFYYSDAFKVAEQNNATRMFGDLGIGLSADKKGMYVIGWNIGYTSAVDQVAGVNTTYTVTEMGPKFGMFFDKERFWSLWATYNLVVNGTYSAAGATSETWRGSSIKIEMGVTPALDTEYFAGVKLVYHSETFNESLIGSSNYSQVTYSRSFIYPALNFSLRY
jgi:hypothetical protein